MDKTRAALEARLNRLRAELAERQKSIPKHSVRPHQIIEIEDLEDEIADIERQLRQT